MTVDGGATFARDADLGLSRIPQPIHSTLVLWKENEGRVNVEVESSPRDSWDDLVKWAGNAYPDHELLSAYMRND